MIQCVATLAHLFGFPPLLLITKQTNVGNDRYRGLRRPAEPQYRSYHWRGLYCSNLSLLGVQLPYAAFYSAKKAHLLFTRDLGSSSGEAIKYYPTNSSSAIESMIKGP